MSKSRRIESFETATRRSRPPALDAMAIEVRAPTFVALCLGLLGCSQDGNAPATGEPGTVEPISVQAVEAEGLLAPVLAEYSRESGVPVHYTMVGEDALHDSGTGAAAPEADLLLFVDSAALWAQAADGRLRPTYSETLEAAIPEAFRDPESTWFGLLFGGVSIAYDRRSIDGSALTDYAALAGERWQERLCLVTSGAASNRSLIAAMIADRGSDAAERTVRGWVRNLAAPVFGDGRALLEAIAAGRCAVGLVGSQHLSGFPDESVGRFWPSPETGRLPIVVLGGGVTRHARNPEGAVALLEWLSSARVQRMLVGTGAWYAANPAGESAAPSPLNPAGTVHSSVSRTDAARLAERAGYR